MSSKQDTKYAAKRRAATRKRNRELLRQIAVYFFVGIIVIGTVSSVFVVGVPSTTITPTPVPTTATNSGFDQLVTQADGNIASGLFNDGISLYMAYLSQNPTNADVHFKVGKAYLDSNNPEPDYVAGVDHLQRAININPTGSFVAEAQGLLTQYGTAASSTAAAMASTVPVTNTTTVTGTTVVIDTPNPSDADVMPTQPIAPTTPITP